MSNSPSPTICSGSILELTKSRSSWIAAIAEQRFVRAGYQDCLAVWIKWSLFGKANWVATEVVWCNSGINDWDPNYLSMTCHHYSRQMLENSCCISRSFVSTKLIREKDFLLSGNRRRWVFKIQGKIFPNLESKLLTVYTMVLNLTNSKCWLRNIH